MGVALRAAVFVNLLLTALLAGVLFDFWFFTAPALGTLPAVPWTQFSQALDREYLTPAPLLYTLVDVSAVLVVLARWRDRHRLPLLLSALALLLGAAATVSTLLVNVPINAEVLSWDPTRPPADWMLVRDRWNTAHALRTGLLVAALVFQLLAVLLPVPGRRGSARPGLPAFRSTVPGP